MRKYIKVKCSDETPQIEDYYQTDRGECYYYFPDETHFGWCTNEARPHSSEHPKCWFKPIPDGDCEKEPNEQRNRLTLLWKRITGREAIHDSDENFIDQIIEVFNTSKPLPSDEEIESYAQKRWNQSQGEFSITDFKEGIELMRDNYQPKQKILTLKEANELLKGKHPDIYDYPNSVPDQPKQIDWDEDMENEMICIISDNVKIIPEKYKNNILSLIADLSYWFKQELNK